MNKNPSMDSSLQYRIKVSGIIDQQWFDYYDSMVLEEEQAEEKRPFTVLTGSVPDQAALISMLNLLYDMRCPLISVECLA